MKNALTLFLILIAQNLFAQQEVEMADQLRQDGKIWVVVGVIAIVFSGLLFYLFSIDRKISKIEKTL
jgi:hypothetical protein